MQFILKGVSVAAVACIVACNSSDGESKNGGSIGATGGTGGAGSGGASNGGTSCTAAAGPTMVEVSSPAGVKYCVDTTEVTQEQYALFLKSGSTEPGTDRAECQGVANYAPLSNLPDPQEPRPCTNSYNPNVTPNHPVVCVGWCAAHAYCKWAGKRLCGKIGGGSGMVTGTGDESDKLANDSNVSQWFNACSQNGVTTFPYGSAYDASACEGNVSQFEDGGWPKMDVATLSKCSGNAAPFSSIFDMSGSVAELTDECMTDTTGPLATTLCAVRGGSYMQPAEYLSCSKYVGAYAESRDLEFGFRCCKDTP